jgi:hypothetical protein
MGRVQVQGELSSVYRGWKADFDSKDLPVEDFSPPLLLNATNEYCSAPRKIVVYGQETLGWSWTRRLQEEYPKYPHSWQFQDLRTFADFLTNDDAIEGLIWGYEQFDFAKSQPQSYRSPFWQAFREIEGWPDAGGMWANLVRVDFKGGSIFSADGRVQQAMLRQQAAPMRREIRVLEPDACIFLTGPDYDSVLGALFPRLEFKRIHDAPERELARVVHVDLPVNSYRTYHPNFLRRGKKWAYLDLIRQSLTG